MNFFVNQAMGIGNSGVEHAEFYRAKRFDQAGLQYRFVFLNLIPELHQAIDKWGLKDNQVLNLWEYLVLGKQYFLDGLHHRIPDKPLKNIVDATNTMRQSEQTLDSGIRVVNHYVKTKDKHHLENKILQVKVYRVELFNAQTNELKVSYSIEDDLDKGSNIVNIHLFDEQGQHLFFRNLYSLHRYFFEQLDKNHFGKSNFIIDRGEFVDDVLLNNKIKDSKIVYIIHADQLYDRDDPKYPLWNNHYEYMMENISQVDKVITATALQRKDMLIDFPNCENKIVAIPVGGVDDFTDQIQEKTSKSKESIKFITASRLANEKHIDIAIKAINQLHHAGFDISFDIYGQGEERAKLTSLINTLGAEKFIKMKGHSSNLKDVYPNYDFFISTSFSEGFGLTYIEALNSGLPVVTFNARFGAQELIKDGVNGYLAKFSRSDDDYNVEQISKAIKNLTKQDYSELEKNTKKSIKKFQNHLIANKWKELINGLRIIQ